MIPNNDAIRLLRNQSSLEPLQSLYLEEWLFYNRPSKRYFALVDKTLSNAYVYAEGCAETIEIGNIDSFNCKKNHCYVLGFNDILYYGKLVDIGSENYYGCQMIANRNQWGLIENTWKEVG